MSRDVPLLVEQKIKLALLILIVSICALSAVFTFGKFLYYKIARDDDKYQEAVEKACDYYHFQVYDYNEDYNRYKLTVEPSVWSSLSFQYKKQYCEKVYETLSGFLWKYKIKPEDEKPYIYLYSNESQVANVFNGYASVFS